MSRPLHLFMTVDAVGGVWHYATELAAALAPMGYRTTLALMGPPPAEAMREAVSAIPGAALIETGLALDWMAPDAETVEAAALALARLAEEGEADIVQLNQPALAGAAAFPAPVVAVAHSCVATWWRAVEGGEMPADFRWQTRLVGAGLTTADRVVCPSAAFAEAVRAAYGLPQRPLVVHNGRSPLALPGEAIHDFAFTAGRLWDRGKDLATLDRAAARLGVPFKAAGPLAGPNGETARFETLHAAGPLDGDALGDCLSARPVFASAALYEPFGLAVLEAAMAGCPLVLSDIPTFRELWDGAAIFVPPRDDRGFADAIETLIHDNSFRLACGDLARQRAERFTPERMATGMAGIYRALLPMTVTARGERVAA